MLNNGANRGRFSEGFLVTEFTFTDYRGFEKCFLKQRILTRPSNVRGSFSQF